MKRCWYYAPWTLTNPLWPLVWRGGDEFVHDPALAERYDPELWDAAWKDNRVAEGWVLTPLDPAERVR